MRRRQFYSANGFVSGNRATINFFLKWRLVVCVQCVWFVCAVKVVVCGLFWTVLPFESYGSCGPFWCWFLLVVGCCLLWSIMSLDVFDFSFVCFVYIPFVLCDIRGILVTQHTGAFWSIIFSVWQLVFNLTRIVSLMFVSSLCFLHKLVLLHYSL